MRSHLIDLHPPLPAKGRTRPQQDGHSKEATAPKFQQGCREPIPEPTELPKTLPRWGEGHFPPAVPMGLMGSGIPSPKLLPSAGNARNSCRREDLSSWLYQHTESGRGDSGQPPSSCNIQESQQSNCPGSRNEKHPKQPAAMKSLPRLEAPALKPPLPPALPVPTAVTSLLSPQTPAAPRVGMRLLKPHQPGNGVGILDTPGVQGGFILVSPWRAPSCPQDHCVI